MKRKTRRTEIVEALSYAVEAHRRWATVQRRRRWEGKKKFPYVGGETYHRDWAKIYSRVLNLLDKRLAP